MSNAYSLLSTGNTFGDWIVTTNALVKENNDFHANNYHKNAGTLYLDDSSLGLQVNNQAIFAGSLQVTGTGSSATIQNNLTVQTGQVYLQNTQLTLVASGLIQANGTNTGLYVANNANIGGVLNVTGNTFLGNNLNVVYNTTTSNSITSLDSYVGRTLNTVGTSYTDVLQANTSANTALLTVTGTAYVNVLQANTSINTANLNVTNNVTTANLVATSAVFASKLYVSGTTQLIGTANTTADLGIGGNLNVPNVLFMGNSTSSANIYNLTVGQSTGNGGLTVQGNFTIASPTIYQAPSFTLYGGTAISAGNFAYFNVNRAPGTNASIRWNETNKEWGIANVVSGSVYRIVTDEYANGSSSSSNSITYATSYALANANTFLQSYTNTANTGLKSYVDQANTGMKSYVDTNVTSLQGQIASNVNTINASLTSSYARANTSGNSFVGTTGSAAPNNGNITYASNNGIIISGIANTLYINSPQDLRTTSSPTFNALTITNALAVTYGGTGAADKNSALFNLVPTTSGVPAGYVLSTGGGGGSSFYWAAGGTGGGGNTAPGTTIQSSRLTYTGNGTGLAYTTPTYVPGAAQLRAYINGVRQFASEYTETSNTVITFNNSPQVNDNILIEVDGYILNPYYANNIPFTAPQGGITASANTIQLAINDIESRKATLISPGLSGVPTTPTAAITTSNTQIASTAYVNNLANSSYTFAHSISGNASTVTNGLYSTSSYSNPTWLTSISGTIVSGAVATATTANALNTSNNYQVNSFGVGTSATGTAGEIRATNNITAYYSDDRLKTRSGNIQNALAKVMTLNGFHYQANEVAQALGYVAKPEVGVSAQEVQAIMPEVVVPAPIDEKYLTVHYDKLVPLLIEAIKELKAEIDTLKGSK